MPQDYDDEERNEEEGLEEEDEELAEEGEEESVMAEDAVVDVAFGEPEDGPQEEQRIIDWVSSFPPGEFQRQVADLFLSDGEIYIMMDKLTVVLPLVELFRLLQSSGAVKEAGSL
jgi:hypothetical protein